MTLRSMIFILMQSNLKLDDEVIVRHISFDNKMKTTPVVRVSATGAIIIEEHNGWKFE